MDKMVIFMLCIFDHNPQFIKKKSGHSFYTFFTCTPSQRRVALPIRRYNLDWS